MRWWRCIRGGDVVHFETVDERRELRVYNAGRGWQAYLWVKRHSGGHVHINYPPDYWERLFAEGNAVMALLGNSSGDRMFEIDL
jgi:hypothetical protein